MGNFLNKVTMSQVAETGVFTSLREASRATMLGEAPEIFSLRGSEATETTCKPGYSRQG